MIAFAVEGPTPGSDSSNVASAVLMFTTPDPDDTGDAALGWGTLVAAAICCGTVTTVGFVLRGCVDGGCLRDVATERGGTYT